jgi:hypothetical protein
MATVTFDGSRVDDANATTNWSNWGATATQEPDYFYQSAYCISCQVKTAEVGEYLTDPGGTVDFSGTIRTVLFKVIQTNFTAIDGNGLQLYVGNDDANHYRYEIYSATTYPALGGFQVVPITPTVSGYWTQEVGTPALGTVDFYGIKSDANAQAKAPNLGMDALDYITLGTGLSLDGTGGTFTDFYDYDVGTNTNRYGILTEKNGIYYINGVLTIGSSTLTTFSDSNRSLVFPDGRVATGFSGINLDLQNASTVITLANCVFAGRGQVFGPNSDTRPDFEVSSTSGSATVDGCSFLNFRNVTFTSAASMDGGRIECKLLTQNSADIENVIIVTSSDTSVATLQDPTFGTTTDLHDVDFVQGGNGHAIEIDTATSYTLTNITFTGYGADTTDSAALDVTASSGTVTINVVGGNSPTYKSAGATVNIVLNPVTTTIHTINSAGDNIVGARVLVVVADGTNYPYQESVSIVSSGGTATVTHTSHGLATNDYVLIEGCNEPEYNGAMQITVSDVDTYTYTVLNSPSSPATGTPVSTFCLIDAETDSNGEASNTKSYGTGDQPIVGRARKGSSSTLYKTSAITGTVDQDSGVTINVVMIEDE